MNKTSNKIKMALKEWKKLGKEYESKRQVAVWRNKKDGDKTISAINPNFTKVFLVEVDDRFNARVINNEVIKSKSQAIQIARDYMVEN